MTDNDPGVPADRDRRDFVTTMHALLVRDAKRRGYQVSYDYDCVITAGAVTIHFTRTGILIRFPDPYRDDNTPVTTTITAPYNPGAVMTIVEGLVHTLHPATPPVATNTTALYLLDQLAGALTRRDGDTAVDILRQLGTVAGPAFADRLLTDLITAGLNRATTGQPGDTP